MHEGVARKMVPAGRALQLTVGNILLVAEIRHNALDIALDQGTVAALLVLEEAGAALAQHIDTPLRCGATRELAPASASAGCRAAW